MRTIIAALLFTAACSRPVIVAQEPIVRRSTPFCMLVETADGEQVFTCTETSKFCTRIEHGVSKYGSYADIETVGECRYEPKMELNRE